MFPLPLGNMDFRITPFLQNWTRFRSTLDTQGGADPFEWIADI